MLRQREGELTRNVMHQIIQYRKDFAQKEEDAKCKGEMEMRCGWDEDEISANLWCCVGNMDDGCLTPKDIWPDLSC